jgi:hypothetical protein
VLDENLNGTPSTGVAVSGTIPSVASSGRGTFTLSGGRSFVFYLGPAGTAVLQETDAIHAGVVSNGTLKLQQNPSFALTQLAGTYSIATAGLSGTSGEDIVGNLTAALSSGTATISAGNLDVNTVGVTPPSSGIALSPGSTFAASTPAERATLRLILGSPLNQTRNFAMYLVSPTEAYVVQIDAGGSPTRLAAGKLLLQF